MSDIVVATRNRKKVEEIQRILEGADVELYSMDEFPDCPEVVEDGDTFEVNALKKAREVSACTGKAAFSDDSGLVVYSIDGEPGVHSARYAGENATDHENLSKLLRELSDIAPENRGAAFVCVIAFVTPNGEEQIFHGRVEGSIGLAPKGSSGFGYDPVFYPEGHDRTFAEMSAGEKDSMSHRGRALEKLRDYFLKN
jgi:XTP/dITP diphosphohydrolase